LWSFV